MKFSPRQEDRLQRFALLLQGKFPGDRLMQGNHVEAARRFELFLLGRDLPFSQESFRIYLLEIHQAAAKPVDERTVEQERLRLYYHSFSKELETAEPPASETTGTPAAGVLQAIPKAKDDGEKILSPKSLAPEPLQPQPFEELPAENEIVCPKCGFHQPRALECAKCGIVFEKWRRVPKGQAGHSGLRNLSNELQRRLVAGSGKENNKNGGLDVLLLYLIAPLLSIVFFALFRGMNANRQTQIIANEQQLVTLNTEIQTLVEPPFRPVNCYIHTDQKGPTPPAPFTLQVPAHFVISEAEEPQIPLRLVPKDPLMSEFKMEEFTLSVRRTWINKAIGTEGAQETENIWNGKHLIKTAYEMKGKKRSQPPADAGRPSWQYTLEPGGSFSKPGSYFLSATLLGWYPQPAAHYREIYFWVHNSYYCDEAEISARPIKEIAQIQALLETRKNGLERTLSSLRRSERLTRAAKYFSFLAMLFFGGLVIYRTLRPVPEEAAEVPRF